MSPIPGENRTLTMGLFVTSLAALVLEVALFVRLDALMRNRGASYRRWRAVGLGLAGALPYFCLVTYADQNKDGMLATALLAVNAGILCAGFGLVLAAQRSERRPARWCRRLLDWRGNHCL